MEVIRLRRKARRARGSFALANWAILSQTWLNYEIP
jgi:hypothetical protein